MAEDSARLLGLEVGQTGNGEPGTATSIMIDAAADDDPLRDVPAMIHNRAGLAMTG